MNLEGETRFREIRLRPKVAGNNTGSRYLMAPPLQTQRNHFLDSELPGIKYRGAVARAGGADDRGDHRIAESSGIRLSSSAR